MGFILPQKLSINRITQVCDLESEVEVRFSKTASMISTHAQAITNAISPLLASQEVLLSQLTGISNELENGDSELDEKTVREADQLIYDMLYSQVAICMDHREQSLVQVGNLVFSVCEEGFKVHNFCVNLVHFARGGI